jgi:hypothetical protein
MKKLLLTMMLVIALPLVTHAESNYSEIVSQGEYGQVSTITGNGTQGQGVYTLDHPRFPGVDSKGNVYFLDGSQKTMKLRKWDGEKNTTLVDMNKNVVTAREGDFYSTGLQVIKDTIYFSSKDKAYKLIGDRVTEIDEGIRTYMKENKYAYIFRMEQMHGDLVFMFYKKGDYTSYYEYGFASWNLSTKTMTDISPPSQYYNPSNFFIQDRGIDIATLSGAIHYEKFFPSQFYDHLNTNMGQILDVWIAEDKNIYYAINQDKVYFKIYRITGKGDDLGELVAGGAMGFRDGVADEVRMDYPTDFTWDGSGMIFADRDNNAIRKIWLDSKPLNYEGKVE